MARPKDPNPKFQVKVRLSKIAFARLELEAFSPLTLTSSGRTEYGAKSRIVETALRHYFAHIDEQRVNEQTRDDSGEPI